VGGSVALASEWSEFNSSRGLAASWPQFGSPLGLLLAVMVLNIVSHSGSPEWFLAIGWRIPFLLSLILIVVGFYIRVGILETPMFARLVKKVTYTRRPFKMS
jgi:uncharacterized protein YacL